MFVKKVIDRGLDEWQGQENKICSSHISISFHESMPPRRDLVTHWPIN